MNKRKLASGAVSIALAVTMLSTTAFAAAASFTDVDSKHWAAPSIRSMADRGVMTGVGNNIFAPDKTLTYAEFITMVVRQFYPDKIVDVKGEWYAPYMAVAESAGILKGTEVSAEATIDRYNMAQVMYNVMQDQKMATSPLSDTSKVADWSSVPTTYRDAVSVCYNMGMLSGVDGKGTFNGTGVMTRAQAAVVMDRLIGDEQVAPPTPGEIPAGALAITDTTQLTNACGAMPYPGGFHLDSRTVSFGGSNIGITTRGYATITLTFKASDKDTRLTASARLLGNSIWDPYEEREVYVVPAGQTQTLTFDCSGTEGVGIYIERDDAIGNFAEGWITNMYLS